jgi:hypothetical protein
VNQEETPLYARLLRLRYIQPGAFLCFALFEGSIIFAVLLSFAELASWWAVLAVPLSIAGMVKINDIAAGAFSAPAFAMAQGAIGATMRLRAIPAAAQVVPAAGGFSAGRVSRNEYPEPRQPSFRPHQQGAQQPGPDQPVPPMEARDGSQEGEITQPLPRRGRHAAPHPDSPAAEVPGPTGCPEGPEEPAPDAVQEDNGRVYGTRKELDQDETPAVGWSPRLGFRHLRPGGWVDPVLPSPDRVQGPAKPRGIFNQGRF